MYFTQATNIPVTTPASFLSGTSHDAYSSFHLQQIRVVKRPYL